MISIDVNGEKHDIDVDPEMPLLWILRDVLAMTGTKFGCGVGQCGACTVHIDGVATRSCQTPASQLPGKRITTIEGLAKNADHPVLRAWISEQVSQCGYCQTGQIMSAASLLAKKPQPTDGEIDEGMAGNLCRCGTYQRVRSAIHAAAKLSGGKP